jgi:hypothetical protein
MHNVFHELQRQDTRVQLHVNAISGMSGSHKAIDFSPPTQSAGDALRFHVEELGSDLVLCVNSQLRLDSLPW